MDPASVAQELGRSISHKTRELRIFFSDSGGRAMYPAYPPLPIPD
jgi:hypothetical protein